MNPVSSVFTEYERRVLREIALRRVRRNPVQRLLEAAGRPVGGLLTAARSSKNFALRGVSGRIQVWVEEGLIKTVHVANRLARPEDTLRRYAARKIHVPDIESLRYLPLSQLDMVADSFRFSSAFTLGAEGAILGGATTLAEGIPGAQLIIPSLILTDVTSSLTLLSRHTCHVANAYGYSSRATENLPHLLGAMAPDSSTSDEGYLTIKAAVVTSMREAGQFITRASKVLIDRQLLEREAPQMVRLIAYVAERLGVVVTQKELGILIPVAGAVFNSSLNVAFNQLGHYAAKDYFRRLILEQRYGDELVAFAIAREIEAVRAEQPGRQTPAVTSGSA
ncbi:MAG TPA: EcsC family protein [Terriglobia bacterium]|nr:EcsC family protein [Terriglobia bacterium]